ncbi:CCA tRNA nucleotidyltransferase, partial [candidate division WOR-3 bacterium]|nr:CCA tRNA nucleotidyltransferase [candidate division WOR-3 bacterium]
TRTETYARPAVLPTVKPADIEADLSRRDFSVNAMALNLAPSSFGQLLDPLDGRRDLQQRRIRVLHDRSFHDDPTRVFRAVRFAVRLGFNIEPHTLGLLREAVHDRVLARLTPERALYELRLVCREALVLPIVESLVHERVLRAVWGWTAPRRFLPGLCRLVQQGAGPELLFVYWLSFLPVTERFPIRREEQEAACWLNRFEPVCGVLVRSFRASTIYQLLKPIPEPALRILAALEPEASARRIRDYLDRLARVKTELTGKDLKRMGVEPGPRYRYILDRLLYARLDGRAQNRDDELSLCRRLLARRPA